MTKGRIYFYRDIRIEELPSLDDKVATNTSSVEHDCS